MRQIPVRPSRPPGGGWLRFALLVGAVVLAGLAGYVGYVSYPRFDLPASVGVGLLALAAGAGVASFFSPCAFPLLLTLLGRHVRGRLGAAVGFAAAFSVGAVLFLLLLGTLIVAGGAGIAASVTFTSGVGIVIRVVAGVVLVVLGLIQARCCRSRSTASSGSPDHFPRPRRSCAGTIPSQVLASSGSGIWRSASAERGPSWPVWPGRH